MRTTTFRNSAVDDKIYSITLLWIIKELSGDGWIWGVKCMQGTLAERFKALNLNPLTSD